MNISQQTIEQLRQSESKVAQQSQSFLQLKNALAIDVIDHDELIEEIIQRIERLNNEKTELTQEIQRREKLRTEHKQLVDVHTALEEKFNQLLADKAGLENQLDSIRVQMQTTESKLSHKKEEFQVKFVFH